MSIQLTLRIQQAFTEHLWHTSSLRLLFHSQPICHTLLWWSRVGHNLKEHRRTQGCA